MAVFKRKGSDKYQYEFELAGQRYRGTTGKTSKRDAEAWVVAFRQSILDDIESAQTGKRAMTLGQVAQGWLADTAHTLRDHANNESRVRKLFGEALLNGQVVQATYETEDGRTVPRFAFDRDMAFHKVAQLSLVHLKEARLREGNSRKTINRELSLIQSLTAWARTHQVRLPEPELVFADLKTSEGLKTAKARHLTLEQERVILADLTPAPRKDGRTEPWDWDNHDLVVLLLDTGGRYSEIAKLSRQQVLLEDGLILLDRTKVNKEGLVPITDRARPILERRLADTRGRRWLFPAWDTRRRWADDDLPRGHATAAIQAAFERAGLNSDPDVVARYGRVTPHSMRDTFATRLVQSGADILLVSELLGHATVAMTQKYARLGAKRAAGTAAAILNQVHAEGDDKITHSGERA